MNVVYRKFSNTHLVVTLRVFHDISKSKHILHPLDVISAELFHYVVQLFQERLKALCAKVLHGASAVSAPLGAARARDVDFRAPTRAQARRSTGITFVCLYGTRCSRLCA